MVKTEMQEVTYSHPFSAVTASLWSKYDDHKNVKEVDVLSRHVDAEGRLHSTRLLTMRGNIPSFIKPFVPTRNFYLLEEVVVDADAQSMQVHTENINMRGVLEASSESRYSPVHYAHDATLYKIAIKVQAFPNRAKAGGWLSGKLESWAAGKLLGNVSKGTKFIDAFCRQQVSLCEGRDGKGDGGDGKDTNVLWEQAKKSSGARRLWGH
mmetsp:Transcript_56071/g.137536  ORF Transcript_56071/g.137536 Transcript_56071/m.137536 type:complete len:209 (+) Transcript_56071:221-847(+)